MMYKILVVDDKPDSLSTTRGILTDAGYMVKGFDNSREALDAIKKEPFDIAVIDIRLFGDADSDVSGLILAKAIKSAYKTICVIFVTGFVIGNQWVKEIVESGEAFACVEKGPNYYEELLITVEGALSQYYRFLEKTQLFDSFVLINSSLLCCRPSLSGLQNLLPSVVYVKRALPDIALSGMDILSIRAEVLAVDPKASVIIVMTNQRLTDQGWAQIGTLRMDGFIVIPLDETIFRKGLAEGHERALIRSELEKRLGSNYDPYDVRDPVASAFSFFGRDALVEDLLRRMNAGGPVGLFGLRKLGKSSLLQVVCTRAQFPVALVNLQTVGQDAALEELYSRILRSWKQWVYARYGLDWQLPSMKPGNIITMFTSITKELLERISDITGETRLGLFLDEAELIIPRPDGSGPDLKRYISLVRSLRGLVDEGVRLSLVVASLNPSINRINAWDGEQNPTLSFFQEIYLSPLAREDCIQMIRNIGRQVGLTYDDASVNAIADLSGGHPSLARQLCSQLYRQRNCQSGDITIDAIPTAVEHFIYDDQTVTHLDAGIWEDAGNIALWGEAQAQLNQSILLELARENEPVAQENLLKASDARLRRTALINLERYHFIHQPKPGYFALRFGLLHKWLRYDKLGLD